MKMNELTRLNCQQRRRPRTDPGIIVPPRNDAQPRSRSSLSSQLGEHSNSNISSNSFSVSRETFSRDPNPTDVASPAHCQRLCRRQWRCHPKNDADAAQVARLDIAELWLIIDVDRDA